jgi:hypothetical protein
LRPRLATGLPLLAITVTAPYEAQVSADVRASLT